jgi:hypothetical protein
MNTLYPRPDAPNDPHPTANFRARTPRRDDGPVPPQEPVESVEAFLARGGAIQKLDHAARGQPVLRTAATINEAKAKHKAAQATKRRR